MRLSFPNGEHADVMTDSGVVGIGGAEGNTVRLDRPGIKPRHARLVLDQRGMILEVLDAHARIHVNARPVLEKALLRLGDVVNIDDVAMVLKPDRDDSIDTRVPVDDGRVSGVRPSVASVVLRGVSGAHFGKTIAIGERLVIGQGGHGLELDEPGMNGRHASIDAAGDQIHLRGIGAQGNTSVNGVSVHDAVLHPGDQISFGRNRFVLEAPGFPARGEKSPTPANFAPAITQTMPAIQIPDPAPATPERTSSVWWLIVAAALIGLGIAALLWFGSR